VGYLECGGLTPLSFVSVVFRSIDFSGPKAKLKKQKKASLSSRTPN
jgi:hypothetical protein